MSLRFSENRDLWDTVTVELGTRPMSDVSQPLRQPEKVGFDHLADDVFGLSLRGLRTIKDAFLRPAVFFATAREPDWERRYTPSVRLFTSLILLILALRFLWAGPGTVIEETFANQMQILAERYHPIFGTRESLDKIINTYFLIYPGAVVTTILVISLATFIWGKGTSWGARVRLFFAAMIPNATLSIVMVSFMGLVPPSFMLATVIVPMFVNFTIDSLTIIRGLKPVFSLPSRIWRGVLFALLSFLSLTLASLVSSIGAGFILGKSVEYELQQRSESAAPSESEAPSVPIQETSE
ncbi:MAG: hypothetical protein MRY64_15595 [Hyphomonadaceae bacterium]|nr:hypothetical protein [Hyphomonadaceae bacterium]